MSEPDPRLALVTAAIHLTRHPRHPHYCECSEFARAALEAIETPSRADGSVEALITGHRLDVRGIDGCFCSCGKWSVGRGPGAIEAHAAHLATTDEMDQIREAVAKRFVLQMEAEMRQRFDLVDDAAEWLRESAHLIRYDGDREYFDFSGML